VSSLKITEEEKRMPERTKVVGARAPIIWLLIIVAVFVVAALAVGGLVIYPQLHKEQNVEQHHQAGVAFQNVGD
jgi:flagellar basal body-associated protein FliL